MSTAAIIGWVLLILALLYLALSIAYLAGAYNAVRDADDGHEISEALGAYGQILRTEAEAMGVTVEELLSRDERLARGEQ